MERVKEDANTGGLYLLIFLLCLVIASDGSCGSKQNAQPEVFSDENSTALIAKSHYPDYAILRLEDLNEDLQAHLRFNYGNAQPGYVKDDFDGDGFMDYALLLLKNEAKPMEKLVVLRGQGNGTFVPTALFEIGGEVASSYMLKNCFIRCIPPGEVEEWDHTRKVVIQYPGIEWINWESSSCVYYWQNGEFHHIWTSD